MGDRTGCIATSRLAALVVATLSHARGGGPRVGQIRRECHDDSLRANDGRHARRRRVDTSNTASFQGNDIPTDDVCVTTEQRDCRAQALAVWRGGEGIGRLGLEMAGSGFGPRSPLVTKR